MTRSLIAATGLALTLLTAVPAALAFDDAKYPDLSGQWNAVRLGVRGQPAFDPSKPWGLGQQAPLTPEYRAILEASVKDQANGGQGNWPSGTRCLPTGMPAMMTVYTEMEFIVLPEITHILINHNADTHRRIYTDGRAWPKEVEPSFLGYSIGQWVDEDGDGKYDVLAVETRHLKGPRALDPAGMPLHADNQSVIQERIYFDKAIPRFLHDEITLIDNAFTRPWTVLKTYQRNPARYPRWREDNCPPVNVLVKIGNELYFYSGDGNLMPTRKDQPPPDLRYFNQARK